MNILYIYNVFGHLADLFNASVQNIKYDIHVNGIKWTGSTNHFEEQKLLGGNIDFLSLPVIERVL